MKPVSEDVRGQVREQARRQVGEQVYGKVMNRVYGQVVQVSRQSDFQIWWQVRQQIKEIINETG